MNKLYPYQIEGINFLKSQKTALLADDMGLGKTVQLIKTCEELKAKKVLVICPANIKLNWRNEFAKWFPTLHYCEVISGTDYVIYDLCSDNIGLKVYIVNYELLNHNSILDQLGYLKYDVIIIDEGHYCTNKEALRTRNVLSSNGIIHKAKRVYVSTGTPIPNRPRQIFILLKVLAPELIREFQNYEDFAKRYCAGFRTQFGLNDRGASNLEELAERIKPFYIRRLKTDVLDQLPDVVTQFIELEHDQQIQQVLDYEYNPASLYTDTSLLGWNATLRRLYGEAKVPQAVDFITDVLYSKEKLVVYAYHNGVIEKLRDHLCNFGICESTKKVPTQKRQAAVDEFVSNPDKRIFLAQFGTIAGVDGLQKVADTIVRVEFDWIPGINDQGRDRINRIGQEKNTIFDIYLYVRGGLEETMLYAVDGKRKNIDKVINVNVHNVRKETNMSIDSMLERIMKATEKLVELNGGTNNSEAAKDTKPNGRKDTTKKDVAAVTTDTLINLSEEILAAAKDPASARAKIKELVKSFGAGKIKEIKEADLEKAVKDFTALKDEVSKAEETKEGADDEL